MERWEELFKNSPVNKIYEEFNQVSDVPGYDTHFKEALQKANHDIKIKEISAKLAGNLLKNSKLNRHSLNNREYCTHLRFWLYEQIMTKYINNDDNKILDIINGIFGGWYSFNSIRSENYTSGNEKCEEYRTYLQYIKEQYGKYKNKCFYGGMAPCNIYYTDIDMYNPNCLLSRVSCDIKREHIINGEGTDEISEKIETSDSQIALDMETVQDYSESPVSVYNVVVASSSILGTFTLFFIFYRLTPLGHMLRTRLLKNNLIDHNIYKEESNEYLENIYDQENRIYDTSIHNVGYNPLNIP
ncbi:PIR Superfamily Protein [Plasmodium ovale wallikeri]|uniref:PIR Superfamily Protein n=1 Tax=Plasmodium ovale wallikeri TaxID=864142 RepID=A0A1A9ANU6_PLAOA|nr:PIR Superfamily Protein [Plasmodium ovale wallikeri]SBT58344.1 PIR Superfamily Protein [Plasmodium ovale wallikeri]